MKILALSDEECPALWDYYTPGRLDGYDLILACGDLKSSYLSFVVTMAHCPILWSITAFASSVWVAAIATDPALTNIPTRKCAAASANCACNFG